MYTHLLLIVAITIGRSSCQDLGKRYIDLFNTIPSIPTPLDAKNADSTVEHEHNAVGCGYRNIDPIGSKIDDDTEADFGEFPWMIAILRSGNTFLCGGSLIAPQVVLTRAHWIYSFGVSTNQYTAVAGEWDSSSKIEQLPEQERQVAEVIFHELFDNETNLYDIALLILAAPFVLDVHIKPICLPPLNFNFDFARCQSTGWGREAYGKGQNRNILKRIELPVVRNEQCQSNLRQTRLGMYFELHPSFMCAGGERGKDMCKGDGGSPLVCPIPGTTHRYYQAGIVSWGIGCGSENVPGVYTKVSYMRAWIDQKLSRRNIGTSSYTP